jgi:hypothetical protein
MRQRRFEEVLDECISAYLDGRRSVEDSLSLYPSIARRLEPLLRAAADTYDAFQAFRPPLQSQERIRQRIVRAAAERAAARALTRQIDGFGSGPRQPFPGWTAVGAAVAGLAALFIVGGAVLSGALTDGGGNGADETTGAAPAATAGLDTSIMNARQSLNAIQQKASAGRDIGLRDLDALTGATRTLVREADPEVLEEKDADELEEIIHEQISLLERLNSRSTKAEQEQIETALGLTYALAESLGIEDAATASPTATAEPTQAATTTPEAATPTATPAETPGAPPTPTLAP